MADAAEWLVLLIGGSSGVGKTTVAPEVARRLGAAWLMVDDLRLALRRSGLPIPDSARVEDIHAPGGLVEDGETLTPAVEVVIENHVDQRAPIVIEGDGILPSIFERPSVRERAAGGRVRAVWVHEPDADALLANLVARGRGGWRDGLGWYARRSVAHGEWLRREAEQRGLATVPARPPGTLADRVLAAAGLMRPAETRPRHGARGSLQAPNGQAYSFVAGVDEARRAHVTDRLRAFNEAHLAADHAREPLETYVLDDDGCVVGGLIGGTIWGWLEVAVLWIDVPLRGQGLGTELMRRAEQEAVERGCTAARLSTWDFQALEFYRRLGYVPYGRLDEYPPGHSVHYLRKELSA